MGVLEKHGSPFFQGHKMETTTPLSRPSSSPQAFSPLSRSFSHSFPFFQEPPSTPSWRDEKSPPRSYLPELNPTAIRKGAIERRTAFGTIKSTWTRPRRIKI